MHTSSSSRREVKSTRRVAGFRLWRWPSSRWSEMASLLQGMCRCRQLCDPRPLNMTIDHCAGCSAALLTNKELKTGWRGLLCVTCQAEANKPGGLLTEERLPTTPDEEEGGLAEAETSSIRAGDEIRERLRRQERECRPFRHLPHPELIYRIYQVDPLTCTCCGAQMKILAFITEPSVRSRRRLPPGPALTRDHRASAQEVGVWPGIRGAHADVRHRHRTMGGIRPRARRVFLRAPPRYVDGRGAFTGSQGYVDRDRSGRRSSQGRLGQWRAGRDQIQPRLPDALRNLRGGPVA